MPTQRGFTWIGFLALAFTLGILILAAAPNLAATITGNRDNAQITTLLTSLQLARRVAMQSGTNVAVTPCPEVPGARCDGTSWNGGWRVHYVTPPPGAARLIRRYPALAFGNHLSDTAGAQIVFYPSGLTNLSAPATFTLCDRRGAHEARALLLFISGLAQVSATPGRNVDGGALTCPA